MAVTQYDTTGLKDRVNKSASEQGGVGQAGLYRHPETKQEAVTKWDPLYGDAQSNAFERLGFVRVGDAPEGYEKALDLTTVTAAAGESDSLKGLSARMNALEGVQAENERLNAELEKLRKANEAGASTDSTAVVESVQKTKEDAAQNVADRGQGDATDQVGNPKFTERDAVSQEANATETGQERADRLNDERKQADEVVYAKDFEALNHEELDRVAELEGADVSEAKTKAEKREVILANRENGNADEAADDKKESENE